MRVLGSLGLLLALTRAAAAEEATLAREVVLGVNGTSPAVAIGTTGQALVAWSADAFPGRTCSTGSLAALRLRAADDGSPVGGRIEVNSWTAGHTSAAQVAAEPDGGFVVAWVNSCGGPNVLVRRLRADGKGRAQEFLLGDGSTGALQPRLGAAPDGRLAVAWEETRFLPVASAVRLRLARYGPRLEPLARPTTLHREDPLRRSLLGGVAVSPRLVVVAWTELAPQEEECPNSTAAVAIVDWATGAPVDVTRWFGPPDCRGGPRAVAALDSALGPGVVFSTRGHYSLLRLAPASGRPVGDPLEFAARTPCDTGADPCERLVALASDPRGRFLVVWERRAGLDDAARYDLFAQLFGREGRARSPAIRVNRHSSRRETHAQAALAANGAAVVAWETDLGGSYLPRRVLARTLRFR